MTSLVAEQPSITFLNMSGDITITWDAQNRDKILELVRKKMAEGYVFFTTRKVPLLRLYREVKITEKNIDSITSLVVSDADFEKFTAAIAAADADVGAEVSSGRAHLSKRKGESKSLEAVERLKKAEDVIDNQAIAVRPYAGG